MKEKNKTNPDVCWPTTAFDTHTNSTQKKRTFHALHRQFVLENEGRRETQAGLGNYLFCALDVANEKNRN